MTTTIHESGEMYLETILRLQQSKSCVRSVDIVENLEYSKSSVSRGVNILKNRGFITVDDDGVIAFTAVGLARAKEIYERHKVLSDYLMRIGVDAESAEADACRIEHVISENTFQAIKKHVNKK